LYSYVSGSDDEVDVIDDTGDRLRAVPSGNGQMQSVNRPYVDSNRSISSGIHWPPPDGTPRDVPPPAEPDDDDDDASDVSSPSWVRSESEEDESDGRAMRHGRGGGDVRDAVGRGNDINNRAQRRQGRGSSSSSSRVGNVYSKLNSTG
jgi:hypothetical protein